jgi:hypothetical protein
MSTATRIRVPLRARDSRVLAVSLAAAASLGFVIARPPVGDLLAAQARRSAVVHGVGLDYWFSWFAGTVPGNYSVLVPFASKIVGAGLLAAASTVVVIALTYVLLRGSRHPVAGTWLAAVGASFSLWSGRVPFALGTALMLAALLGVRAGRRWCGALAAAATALASPVSAVFLVIGLTGVVAHDRTRRATALIAAGTVGGCLLGLAAYFGVPGPEGFPAWQVALAGGAIAVMLLARPPAYVRTVLLVSLAACLILALVPNGMGSNIERLTWICLPVAVVATSRARPPVALLAAGLALSCSISASVYDLYLAAQPMSARSYYRDLVTELDTIPELNNYRVEVVPDGTHAAAYALLDHAQLARGYETQSDNKLDAVLNAPTLNPSTFESWLDNNAVGYVVLDRTTLTPGPEDRLVRSGSLPYLHQIWSDAHLRLFAVSDPTPIVGPPGHISHADQASLTITTPHPGRLPVRVRWSRFLHITPPGATHATLQPDGSGWTILIASRPGTYELAG